MAGLKGGLLTFGGAYTAIPYVRADTVGRGWLERRGVPRRRGAGQRPARAAGDLRDVRRLSSRAASQARWRQPPGCSCPRSPSRWSSTSGSKAWSTTRGCTARSTAWPRPPWASSPRRWFSSACRPGTAPAHAAAALPIFALAALAAWRLKGKWVTPAIVAGRGRGGRGRCSKACRAGLIGGRRHRVGEVERADHVRAHRQAKLAAGIAPPDRLGNPVVSLPNTSIASSDNRHRKTSRAVLLEQEQLVGAAAAARPRTRPSLANSASRTCGQ